MTRAPTDEHSSSARCATCGRSRAVCVCDRTERLSTRLEVLILQHPQEQDVELGSARLLAASLERSQLRVGLSWRSLSHALGRRAQAARWAVLFPDAKARPSGAPYYLAARGGKAVDPRELEGLVVLDGTWAQAKALWWRNPWLLKLARLTLFPREPSIYGRIRREPRKHYVSTLESAAEALVLLGEDETVRQTLRRVFRTLVQRARDAGQP